MPLHGLSPITRKAGVTYATGTDLPTHAAYLQHKAGADDWEIAHRYGVTTDEVEFAIAYEAKRARRAEKKRDEPTRLRVNRGRSQKRRGYQCEKRIEAALGAYGFTRVPMSGALGGVLTGDLRRPETDRRAVHIVECKQRRGGHATLRRWLKQGGADLLVVDPVGGEEPFAVLTLTTLAALFHESAYDGAEGAA
jgi:uncharacterized protein (DUF433 family)